MSCDPANLDPASASAVTNAERRRSLRNECSAKGWLSAESGTTGRNHRVSVTNLSLHGMGFNCEAELSTDSVHWVVLDAGGLRASSRVRIISYRKRDGEQAG